MKVNSEQEMLAFGTNFAKKINCTTSEHVGLDQNSATVLELLGDVGTGKTTFTRGLAHGLGADEAVTSPSFTISKVYALPKGKNLIHYDFYRLPDPGLMIDDLAEAIRNPNNIVIVEWGESVRGVLPDKRIQIEFVYNDDGTREIRTNNTTVKNRKTSDDNLTDQEEAKK